MFPSFEIFGKTVGMYAVCSIVGLIVAVLFFTLQAKKKSFPFEDVLLAAIVVGVGLLLGSHALYGLTRIKDVVYILGNLGRFSFSEALRLIGSCFGGAVFYGGFFGACLFGGLYLRRLKLAPETKRYLTDVFACSVPLFHAFGRVGCFLGGCCYGVESRFGFTVHGNTYSPLINDVNRFPVALAEAFCNLCLFFVLWWLLRRGKMFGRLIFVYGVSYSLIRFSLEFLRGDAIRGVWFGFSTSQWISIILFFTSVILLIRTRKNNIN